MQAEIRIYKAQAPDPGEPPVLHKFLGFPAPNTPPVWQSWVLQDQGWELSPYARVAKSHAFTLK